jgi:hypothetical protein
LIDQDTSAVQRIIALQYNPDTLIRTLQVQGVSGEGADRSEALRLKGPPIETIKLDAEIDATDQLELADPVVTQFGIQPQLAALEMIVYPASSTLQENNILAQSGTLEIARYWRRLACSSGARIESFLCASPILASQKKRLTLR